MNFDRLKKIIIPSFSQLALYVLISLILFVFVSFNAIVDKIKDQAHFNDPIVKQAFEVKLAGLNNIPALNIIMIVIFWSTIGLLIYTVFWLGITMLTQARNEIVVETDYVNRGSLKDRVRIPLIQVSIFLLLLVVIIVTLGTTFPAWVQQFGKFLLSVPYDWAIGLTSLVIAFIGSAINMHLIKILISSMLEVDHLIKD